MKMYESRTVVSAERRGLKAVPLRAEAEINPTTFISENVLSLLLL